VNPFTVASVLRKWRLNGFDISTIREGRLPRKSIFSEEQRAWILSKTTLKGMIHLLLKERVRLYERSSIREAIYFNIA
jgi:hypothetical protein